MIQDASTVLHELTYDLAVHEETENPDTFGRHDAANMVVEQVKSVLGAHGFSVKPGGYGTTMLGTEEDPNIAAIRTENFKVQLQATFKDAGTWLDVPLTYDPRAKAFPEGEDIVVAAIDRVFRARFKLKQR